MGFSQETLPSPATLASLYAKRLQLQLSQRAKPRSRHSRSTNDNLDTLLNDLITAYSASSNQARSFHTSPPAIHPDSPSEKPLSHDPISSSPSNDNAQQNFITFPSRVILGRLNTGVGESSHGISRTRSSSILSSSTCPTSPSIISRLRCDSAKSTSTTSLTSVDHTTMGSFTPVSARTAATSLRPFAPSSSSQENDKRGTFSFPSRLGMGPKSRRTLPVQWNDDDERESDKTEADSSDSDWTLLSPPDAAYRARRRSIPNRPMVPSLCLTHSSFISPSAMTSFIPNPLRSQSAQNSPIAARHPSTLPSPTSKYHHRRSSTLGSSGLPSEVAGKGKPKGLDPTLAALEKACRLKAKTVCAICGVVGYDFPRVRTGEALCARDCRLRWKALQAKAASMEAKRSVTVVL